MPYKHHVDSRIHKASPVKPLIWNWAPPLTEVMGIKVGMVRDKGGNPKTRAFCLCSTVVPLFHQFGT